MTKLSPRELLEELKSQQTEMSEETASQVSSSNRSENSDYDEDNDADVSLFDSVFKTNGSGGQIRQTVCPPAGKENERISSLFNRVNSLLSETGSVPAKFVPHSPDSLRKAGLTEDEVERLIFRYLLAKGVASGRKIASQHKLPFALIDPLLKKWKHEQLVDLRNSAEMGDYIYAITTQGRDRAQQYSESCSYYGAAPVKLQDYLRAMELQSIAKQSVSEEDLRRAFSDLLISPGMLDKLGPAINSGRGMFLFGEPGNGKTSIAERVTSCFGSTIWIPRALGIDGDIIRLFDPGVHEAVELDENDSLLTSNSIDHRWVQIVRPTVIAGGELTMSELEVVQHAKTGICESPLQLKSNCGTLVIDDFGRQRMPVDELLNRWIVPLEKRYDFLNLPSGKKIQVPFDQLIIFSTNLEPKDLVDGAFLRRIPYKIEVDDPSRADFIKLFEIMAPKFGMTVDRNAIEYLIETHYEKVNRPFRACQPRDLLLQVRNFCVYKNKEKKMTPQSFDFAVENYFSVM